MATLHHLWEPVVIKLWLYGKNFLNINFSNSRTLSFDMNFTLLTHHWKLLKMCSLTIPMGTHCFLTLNRKALGEFLETLMILILVTPNYQWQKIQLSTFFFRDAIYFELILLGYMAIDLETSSGQYFMVFEYLLEMIQIGAQ